MRRLGPVFSAKFFYFFCGNEGGIHLLKSTLPYPWRKSRPALQSCKVCLSNFQTYSFMPLTSQMKAVLRPHATKAKALSAAKAAPVERTQLDQVKLSSRSVQEDEDMVLVPHGDGLSPKGWGEYILVRTDGTSLDSTIWVNVKQHFPDVDYLPEIEITSISYRKSKDGKSIFANSITLA